MQTAVRLTPAQPSRSVDITNFVPTAIVVFNPTPSPIYIAIGQPGIPTQAGADVIVPAAQSMSFPISTSTPSFGITFGDATALTTAPTTGISGLFRYAVVSFLDKNEDIPSFGSAPFASLSLSTLFPLGAMPSPGGYIGGSYFDLNAWGGAHILILPSNATGQGILQIEVKDSDPSVVSGWTIYGQWAFWPNIPLSLAVPRTTRYVKVFVNSAGVAGDPAIGGLAVVRASVAEISDLAATPSTSSLSKAIATPHLGSQLFVYCTIGLKATTFRVNMTTAQDFEVIFRTGPGPAGPWALAAFREQNGGQQSLARTIGQLDAYLQIEVLDLSITPGGVSGTLAASIQETPDTSALLALQLAALGDVNQPVNVGQSIFHLLQQIDTTQDTNLPSLPIIHNDLLTIDSRVDTLEALIAATNTKLDSIIAQPNGIVNVVAVNPTIAVAAVYQNIGAVLVPGWYIVSAGVSYQVKGPMPDDFFIQLATGTPAAPVSAFFGASGTQPEGVLPPMVYSAGGKAGGVLIPAGHTTLWGYCAAAPTFLPLNIAVRPP